MKHVNLGDERIGQISKNAYGSLMEIVRYGNKNDVWIKFSEYGNLRHTTWQQFREGKVKNPYDKSVYGIGYLGEEKYKPYENGKITKQYITWKDMLKRCYSEKYLIKNPTYRGCSVDERWHNFQNFAEWYDENYYEVDGKIMCLDKDILAKGNKTYSPEFCVFVPQRINTLFIKKDENRGNSPIGVIHIKTANKYQANCINSKGKIIYIKQFNTPEEAFYAYKEFKEMVVKEVAEEYKDKIPNKLYNAMMSYIVEITD